MWQPIVEAVRLSVLLLKEKIATGFPTAADFWRMYQCNLGRRQLVDLHKAFCIRRIVRLGRATMQSVRRHQ
ncbi:MAG: hypothetical protein O3C21_13130 [Verrucomicrobia bacterium]|nr:hypothetical protein [Verrucomicrobiota bacterium]